MTSNLAIFMLHQKGFKIRKFRERNVRLTQPKAMIFSPQSNQIVFPLAAGKSEASQVYLFSYLVY